MKRAACAAAAGLFVAGCGIVSPEIDDETMLDGDSIIDSALVENTYFLVSDSLPNPNDAQRAMPVLVAAHGFTASTFEWREFREFADSAGDFMVSQVLLGGHGRSYEEFKKASWQDWQRPIVEEYAALANAGYQNISLAGSSTGGTLILEMLSAGDLDEFPPPKNVFLIDPIVAPGNKMLTLIDLVGPILGTSKTHGTDVEKLHWYSNRPQEALKELMEVITRVRKELEAGFRLPDSTSMKLYKSVGDEVAEPVSALMIYKGVRTRDGEAIEVDMVDSRLHVFTRLRGRDSPTHADSLLQAETFRDFQSRLTAGG